ncbi:MAG: RelA/SpoT domain-containing protein [Prevotellaceae bacterium]|jgi:ppGpp synthetase/RelA/SpoT-type nucleotidyltranferase|nr:RelA/SpoT domain-containing protein [Prevotellaceae bacterium]
MYEGLILIERNIKETIESSLKRTGLLYRLFSRIKDANSINEKIDRKIKDGEPYQKDGKLMQDIIGFRITTYFNEDIKILIDYFSSCFEKIDLQYDEPKTNEFNPLRKNLVCRMSGDALKYFEELKNTHKDDFSLIDSTFEIQFRTTLSEGWHEVDHNMRYKCKREWKDSQSRIFNGIYATLETSDHALITLFENNAYHHYKEKNWTGMLRNKYRLRFDLAPLDAYLSELLDKENEIAKLIFRIERCAIINKIMSTNFRMKITFDNIVYLCNYLAVKNSEIYSVTPDIIKDDFREYFGEFSKAQL